jgi:predicted sulfurtransferase
MIKRSLLILIGLIFTLSLSNIVFADKTPQQLVEEARSEVKSVSIHDVKRMMDRKENVIILDVRDKKEFEKGHIPGAMHISRGLLEFMVEKKIPDKDAKIVVY